jgi:DNA processing protein
MTEMEALIALNTVPGLGPVKIYRMINVLGGASRVIDAARSALTRIEGIGDLLANGVAELSKGPSLKNELDLMKKFGVSVFSYHDAGYPELLKNIYDPPPVLYVKGSLLESDNKGIGVVGTRRPTQYGRNMAYRFSGELAELGLTVVSGLARGIDRYAHTGALDKKGRTIAVLGNGLSYLYPPEHRQLSEKISLSGALVSEFSMSMGPLPQNFPRRNRIISGLTLGSLIVEAPVASGALITAHWAVEQGREVFAIPGFVGIKNSQGPHQLIKTGAKLVECIDDILEEIGFKRTRRTEFIAPIKMALSDAEKKVFEILTEQAMQIDEICRQSVLPINELSGILVMLELKGYIKQLGGKKFVKNIFEQ